MMSDKNDSSNDINSYEFSKRVQTAINLMNEDQLKSFDCFNEIIDDFKKFSIEEIKENDLSSEFINSLNAKASLLNARDEIDEAEESFDMILNHFDDKDYTALMNKALIFRKRRDYDNALSYYDMVADFYPDRGEYILAIESEILEEMKIDLDEVNLEDYDKQFRDLIEKGLFYKNKNRLFEALQCYDRALELDSNSHNLIYSLSFDIKKEFFKLFLFEDIDINMDELSRKKGAILHYLFIQNNYYYAYVLNQEILDENNNDLFALNAKGMIFFLLDDYQSAIKYLKECIALDENYLYPYFNIALCLKRIGEMEEAMEYFNKIKNLPNEISTPSKELLEIFKRAIVANEIYALSF